MTIELKLILTFVFLLVTLLLFGEDVQCFFHGENRFWEELKDVDWSNVLHPKGL